MGSVNKSGALVSDDVVSGVSMSLLPEGADPDAMAESLLLNSLF